MNGSVSALCFGWIDARRKGLDESWFLQRFTPRRARRLAKFVAMLEAGERSTHRFCAGGSLVAWRMPAR